MIVNLDGITIDGPIPWLNLIPAMLSYVAVFIIGMMAGDK